MSLWTDKKGRDSSLSRRPNAEYNGNQNDVIPPTAADRSNNRKSSRVHASNVSMYNLILAIILAATQETSAVGATPSRNPPCPS